MTNQELVAEMLKEYGAMTSRQIAVQLKIKKNVSLTPAQIAGALRPLIVKGAAANSRDERNQMRYWLVKQAW